MTRPQTAIFSEGHRNLNALEYTAKPTTSLADLRVALRTAIQVGATAPADVMFAFGPGLWGQLAADHMPIGFRDFHPLSTPPDPNHTAHTAPATQRDILVWLHAANRDEVMDAVLEIDRILAPLTHRDLDLSGFVYHDSRDLTGFIDGSANPQNSAGKALVAQIPHDQPGGGGAMVMTQKWRHNLSRFQALEVADQERVIGRTKPDSVELQGAAQPGNSHVSRTDLSVDGVAQKMFRRSFPFANATEQGLYFLAFAAEQARFERVLDSMYGRDHGKIVDHLLDFSTPLTGSYWFAPTREHLDAL